GKSQQGTFLKDACAGDDSLRREVESLLRHEPAADSLMHKPAIDLAARSLAGERSQERLGLGTKIGPYRIEELIGQGGMGPVYRARDTRLGRLVAIKIANSEFTERFEREARAIAALNHPRVCGLYDVGPNYLVMEFIEGKTLANRLQHGKLTIEQTIDYGSQI